MRWNRLINCGKMSLRRTNNKGYNTGLNSLTIEWQSRKPRLLSYMFPLGLTDPLDLRNDILLLVICKFLGKEKEQKGGRNFFLVRPMRELDCQICLFRGRWQLLTKCSKVVCLTGRRNVSSSSPWRHGNDDSVSILHWKTWLYHQLAHLLLQFSRGSWLSF